MDWTLTLPFPFFREPEKMITTAPRQEHSLGFISFAYPVIYNTRKIFIQTLLFCIFSSTFNNRVETDGWKGEMLLAGRERANLNSREDPLRSLKRCLVWHQRVDCLAVRVSFSPLLSSFSLNRYRGVNLCMTSKFGV
eukprot:TRINITY_DN17111_c0_g1_i1.p1 TRINITY_DN17111_c0_g1~~TRINITY_DN17111_c0_g1_i1.p1  ORF type:complete len:137 (-),score=0.46 TRINITY_DN17111_c0_g1_i1:124-534(-)